MSINVKICGVKTPEMAAFCAQAGAQYIGIVLHPASPRYVNLDTAVLIAKAAQQAGIIPVAVFVDADKDDILNVCEVAQIDHVQLHGDKARGAFAQLPKHLHKIYAICASHVESVNNILLADDTQENYLLLDSPNPGTGQVIDWTKITLPSHIKCFLAGGLNIHNVRQAMDLTHPFAVDISSGVESTRGEKSKAMISAFINEVQRA